MAVKYCRECGTKFETEKSTAQFCPGCLKKHKRDSWKRNQESYKKPIAEAPKPVPVNISLSEMMALIRYYNAVYKTNYSYGQFVSQVYFGKIDLKKVIKSARLSAQKE